MPVRFTEHTAHLHIPNKWAIRETLSRIARDTDRTLGDLHYILCDNRAIKRLNQKFLGHNYPTDVLTFPDINGTRIDAEIYLGVDTIIENAVAYHRPMYEELLRVIMHALLHCVGFDDHTPEDIAAMRAQESRYITICLDLIAERKGNIPAATQRPQ